jgi:hypothetical protein
MHELGVIAIKSDLFSWGTGAFFFGGLICRYLEYREMAVGMFWLAATWGLAAIILVPFGHAFIG